MFDRLVFTPDDVDLSRSPLRASLRSETYTLGVFNPGMTRLPNGNLLLMARVAEALRNPIVDDHIHAIRRGEDGGFGAVAFPMAGANALDPRKFLLTAYHTKVIALTSLSWLLPIELNAQGTAVLEVHYDRAIAPSTHFQEYGIEDARISLVDGIYYMTTCSVSAERHSTTLYWSKNGLDYALAGIILDHQNKDMLFFEGKIAGKFWALTRPLGDLYFAYPEDSPFHPGPSINLATSPDALHWKPSDEPFLRPRKGTTSTMRIGGGTPPILTPQGWLMLYHGVEVQGIVGIYRTFWALLDSEEPWRIRHLRDNAPLLEANAALTAPIEHQMYLRDVVFTTGIADAGDHYVVASGEADLACRITHVPKAAFAAS
jgi:beta-1,2-mannobiose phosphorylase / 1,2-beta-oligomannan phosphorylase